MNVNANARRAGGALVMAVRDDKPLSVKALLTAGADPNSRNADGERVLSVATRRQETEIEALLKRVRD